MAALGLRGAGTAQRNARIQRYLRSRKLEGRAGLIDGGEDDRAAPDSLYVIKDTSTAFQIKSPSIHGIVVGEF